MNGRPENVEFLEYPVFHGKMVLRGKKAGFIRHALSGKRTCGICFIMPKIKKMETGMNK